MNYLLYRKSCLFTLTLSNSSSDSPFNFLKIIYSITTNYSLKQKQNNLLLKQTRLVNIASIKNKIFLISNANFYSSLNSCSMKEIMK